MQETGIIENLRVILKADHPAGRAGALPVCEGIIDTEDKWNDGENIKIVSERAISPYELSMFTEKYQEEYKNLTRQKVFDEVTKRVFV